ncbi:MAG: hypothetical protein CVU57_29260 [Deltaproteobacteria bacterium HGW-Deltaproteobacteria-15]|jgi:hypothetical protein|nr:MAG: hypothetical protein CVU57_29260 [Deltaproteobacteria bacterium HGW-Deltaproteobacteria-15]
MYLIHSYMFFVITDIKLLDFFLSLLMIVVLSKFLEVAGSRIIRMMKLHLKPGYQALDPT